MNMNRLLAIAVALGIASMAGCNKKEPPATQTLVKVNGEEITVHLVNDRLPPALPPAQAASASRQVLERLIDQVLARQKATEQELDRDPRVIRQIEAARLEIISRAYFEKLGQAAVRPILSDVEVYYRAHPALFAERRVYTLQEVNIDASPDQIEALKTTLGGSKTFADFVAYLKANGYKYVGAEAVRAAEQLPLASVDAFGELRDGQAVFNVRPGGAQVINLVASRSEPLTLERARPAIEQFLLNENRRRVIADDMAALRGPPTRIEYVTEVGVGAPMASEPLVAPEPATTPAPTLPAAK
jgi:EpsD family peptidyl-prolyl cis-trans isomerase